MLLDLLARYLSHVEGEIRKLKGAYVERYEEEILAVFGSEEPSILKVIEEASLFAP